MNNQKYKNLCEKFISFLGIKNKIGIYVLGILVKIKKIISIVNDNRNCLFLS